MDFSGKVVYSKARFRRLVRFHLHITEHVQTSYVDKAESFNLSSTRLRPTHTDLERHVSSLKVIQTYSYKKKDLEIVVDGFDYS